MELNNGIHFNTATARAHMSYVTVDAAGDLYNI